MIELLQINLPSKRRCELGCFLNVKKRRDIMAFKSNAMKQLLAECSVSICDNIDFILPKGGVLYSLLNSRW